MSLLPPLSLTPHPWTTSDLLSVTVDYYFIPFIGSIREKFIFCLRLLYHEKGRGDLEQIPGERVEANRGKGLPRRTEFFLFPCSLILSVIALASGQLPSEY